MQFKEPQETNNRITSRWEHQLLSALINNRIATSTKTVALTTVISLLVIVPSAHAEVRSSSFSPASAIASARQVVADRPSGYLEGLQPVERGHVNLEVEIAGAPIGDSSIRASMVESLWREGRHEDALALLRTLEDQELIGGVGFDWQTPRLTVQPHDLKSSINSTGGAGQVVLEHDPSSGNLFAVVRWGSSWGLFISHDQGASWSESYHYSGLFLIGVKVDLEFHSSPVFGDFAYVAYSYNGNLIGTTAVAKIRRFAAASGIYDEAWGSNTPLTDETRNFKEIALSIGEGIDYVILRDDGRILDLVGIISNPGLPWFNQDTGVTDADRGLAVAYPGPDSQHIGLFITFIGDDDRVKMSRRARPSGFIQTFNVEDPPQSWADKTSVVAEGDIAVVAWECQPGAGAYQGVRTTRIVATSTYANGISTFDGPEVYAPGVDLHDPQVAGIGNAIVYTNGPQIIFRERDSYTASWSNDTHVLNDHGIVPGEGDAFAFERLGSKYGIAYFDVSGDVYFNTRADSIGMMFRDGFESGNLNMWSSVSN